MPWPLQGSTVGAWKPQKLHGIWPGTEDNAPSGWSPKVAWEKSGQIRVRWWSQLEKGIENKRSGFLSEAGSGEGGYWVIRRSISWEFWMIGTGSTGCSTSPGGRLEGSL